ncbi:hypothetical protein GCM10009767_08690 [Kocuria aegyptia]|uniref:Uncharacterized protein n=1 Tax=Kocuria aegyptia TaxID=330943 RepID=A0ABN2KB53_9MICC
MLPSIQTVTVGTGVPPVRPGDPPVQELGSRTDAVVRFADCDRRFGLPPTPEHVVRAPIMSQGAPGSVRAGPAQVRAARAAPRRAVIAAPGSSAP